MIGIGSLLPFVREDLPLGSFEIGLTTAVAQAAGFVSVRLGGRLVARVGPGAAVGVSQLATALGAATAALAPSLPVFFLGLALAGVGLGLIQPPSNILSMGLVSPRRRGLAMSIKQTGATAGGVLAGLILPPVAGVTSWRFSLVIGVAAALSVAVWGVRTRGRGSREPLVLTGGTVEIRRPLLGFYGFVMAGIQLTLFGYVTIYLVDEVRFSPQRAGAGLAVLLAAGTIGRVGWGIVADAIGDRLRILQLTAAGSALTLALFPFTSGAGVWPLLAVAGLCSVGWNGVYQVVVAESAGEAGVGHATAVMLPFMFAGSVLTPPLLGLVVEHLSWSWFWWIAAAGAAVAAAAAVLGSYQRRPRKPARGARRLRRLGAASRR